VMQFTTEQCPLISKGEIFKRRELPEPEPFIRMPNGCYSIGDGHFDEMHRLLSKVQGISKDYDTCVFVGVTDHQMLDQSDSQSQMLNRCAPWKRDRIRVRSLHNLHHEHIEANC
jgi:hypothetical protein